MNMKLLAFVTPPPIFINIEPKKTYALCVYILIKNMGWCLGVIGNLHYDKCPIYIHRLSTKCQYKYTH